MEFIARLTFTGMFNDLIIDFLGDVLLTSSRKMLLEAYQVNFIQPELTSTTRARLVFSHERKTCFSPPLSPHFHISISQPDMETKVKSYWWQENCHNFFLCLSIDLYLHSGNFYLKIIWSMLVTCLSFCFIPNLALIPLHSQGLAHTTQKVLINVQMKQTKAIKWPLPPNTKLYSFPPFRDSPGKNLDSYFPSLLSSLCFSDFTFLYK